MRTSLFRTLGAAAMLLAACPAFAQQPGNQPAARKPAVEESTVRTKDGWVLPISYYSVPNKETPVVILVHGREGNRGVWKGLAEQLQGARFAVVTVDLRKHGESQAPPNTRSTKVTPADHQNMVRYDLEAVKDFLVAKHNAEQLNIRKTAVIAADDGAPVAVNWAADDWLKEPYADAPTIEARTPRGQDVRAIVLLSPTEGVGGVNLGRALRTLRNPALGIAALIGVGELDKEDKSAAEKTYERLTAGAAQGEEEDRRVFLETYPQVKARGVDLLGATRGRTSKQILDFLDQHLKQLPDKWQTRKSRLG